MVSYFYFSTFLLANQQAKWLRLSLKLESQQRERGAQKHGSLRIKFGSLPWRFRTKDKVF
jgi:hypothetical protein